MGMHSARSGGTVKPQRTRAIGDRTPGLVTSVISLRGALRAVIGLNGPEEPHLGPPPTHGLALFKPSLGWLPLPCLQLGLKGVSSRDRADLFLALWRWVACYAGGLFHEVPLLWLF